MPSPPRGPFLFVGLSDALGPRGCLPVTQGGGPTGHPPTIDSQQRHLHAMLPELHLPHQPPPLLEEAQTEDVALLRPQEGGAGSSEGRPDTLLSSSSAPRPHPASLVPAPISAVCLSPCHTHGRERTGYSASAELPSGLTR